MSRQTRSSSSGFERIDGILPRVVANIERRRRQPGIEARWRAAMRAIGELHERYGDDLIHELSRAVSPEKLERYLQEAQREIAWLSRLIEDAASS